MLILCLRYLNRHPAETSLSAEDLADLLAYHEAITKESD